MSEWFYSPYIRKLFKEISHVPEFEKDLKKLVRRFPSLDEDKDRVEFIELYYKGVKENESRVRIMKYFRK